MNLFHVIFSDDYQNVVIKDSKHGTIREFGLVQTQSEVHFIHSHQSMLDRFMIL